MHDSQSRTKLEFALVNAPLPERPPPGHKRNALFSVLAGMTVGGQAVDVNRKLKSVQHYVYRFRVTYGRELRFLIRQIKPGCSRVWRVA